MDALKFRETPTSKPWVRLTPEKWDSILQACNEVDDESPIMDGACEYRHMPDSIIWRIAVLALRDGIDLEDLGLILNQGDAPWYAEYIEEGFKQLAAKAGVRLPKPCVLEKPKARRRKRGAA